WMAATSTSQKQHRLLPNALTGKNDPSGKRRSGHAVCSRWFRSDDIGRSGICAGLYDIAILQSVVPSGPHRPGLLVQYVRAMSREPARRGRCLRQKPVPEHVHAAAPTAAAAQPGLTTFERGHLLAGS